MNEKENKPLGVAYKPPLVFDASTKRRFDDNGFMHVESSHITKEQVAPYYGYEIPNYKRLGLDAKKIYYGYRSAEELKKAVPTFDGLPLLLHHHAESADDPQKEYRVGSVGTSAVWNAPYIDNALSITDKVGIKAIQNGTCREISSAYQYDPDFTAGEFEGTPYDFVMRNIRGNHVALVEEGRAGPDVVVADAQINFNQKKEISVMERLKKFFRGAWDSDPEVIDEPAPIADADDKSARVKAIVENLAGLLPPEKLEELSSALNEIAGGQPEGEKSPEPPAEPSPEEGKEEAPEAPAPADVPDEPEDEFGDEEAKEPEASEPAKEEVPEPTPAPAPEEEPNPAEDAWKKCGIDSDNPEVKSAFMKGYEHGSKEESNSIAQDAQIQCAVDKIYARFNAADEVGKVVGKVRPLAFDSASSIYAHGLDYMGVPKSAYSEASAQDVFRAIVKTREVQIAQDSSPQGEPEFTGSFAGLNNIK